MAFIHDTLLRPLGTLRLSLTDRCNLRCGYCMPEADYTWLPKAHLLRFEELETVVQAFLSLGTRRIRLTGGEPLLRTDVAHCVERLSAHKPEDLALTTNGVRLGVLAKTLKEAGLHRLTVSLDTLHDDRFAALTRRSALSDVLSGIDAAVNAQFPKGLKIDTVVMRGINDDELLTLLAFAQNVGAEIRFIEYMDVGGATGWSMAQVVSAAEIKTRIEAKWGSAVPVAKDTSAPADRFVLPSGQVFGLISSTTQPFCRTCDRIRLTADGQLFTCLYAQQGVDLKGPLRRGATPSQLAELIASVWAQRSDRGAEERHALAEQRTALFEREAMRQKPHLEMHTRGG